jgi:hypothetical protein
VVENNTLTVADKKYLFDRVFTPSKNNGAVNGQSTLIFAYGASGTGKSYTIEALQRSVAERLFSILYTSGEEHPIVLADCTTVYHGKI